MKCTSQSLAPIIVFVNRVLLDADALQIIRKGAIDESVRRGAIARRFEPEVR